MDGFAELTFEETDWWEEEKLREEWANRIYNSRIDALLEELPVKPTFLRIIEFLFFLKYTSAMRLFVFPIIVDLAVVDLILKILVWVLFH